MIPKLFQRIHSLSIHQSFPFPIYLKKLHTSKQPINLNKFACTTFQQNLIDSISVFKQIYGHALIPVSFVVDSNIRPSEQIFPQNKKVNLNVLDKTISWPRYLHGFELGNHNRNIRKAYRKGELDENFYELLNQHDFVFSRSNYQWNRQILPMLKIYYLLHGSHLIPLFKNSAFIVPIGDDRWPKETWGISLSNRVHSIRQRYAAGTLQKDKIDSLNEINFIWNVNEYGREQVLLPAIRCYHNLYGHLFVPVNYTIPENDPRWPESTKGFKLGRYINYIRAGLYPEYKEELEKLGFVWKTRKYRFIKRKKRINNLKEEK